MKKKHILNTFGKKTEKKWDTLYWAVDIHDTCIKANYKANDLPTEFFPKAKEALIRIGNRPDCCLILFTCSHPHEIEKYLKFFEEHGIKFRHVNKNPEAENTAFGFFEHKFYTNFILDDKAGFDPTEDWDMIHQALDEIEKAEILDAIKTGNFKPVAYYTYPTGTVGTSYVFEQNSTPEFPRNEEDQKLYLAMEKAFDDVSEKLNIRKDNKTAIKILIPGINEPIYLSSYDWRHAICKEITTNRGGTEIIIN
jgi:hypothetical protein